MSKGECPRLVVALFTFKGKNNDELCFKKGDIITITQTDDGGWWEGTLHDMTGWFPSNYVKDYKISDIPHTLTKSSPEKVGLDLLTQQKANRSVIIKDIIDSEQANVAELQGLINNFLQPLETANILRRDEYKQLIGNMHDVLNVHQHLLSSLEASLVQDSDIRTGNLFLTIANKIKSVHMLYCSSHAQAVCILDRFRDELNEFMERNGAVSPGILVLTTGLSKPFRRLEKYSTLLQELERHMEPNHPDRGDTQRSVSVYRDIADKCSTMRKQKELALTVLAGGIKGWEGENLHTLGDIIYVGPVILLTGMDHRDRYLVLFSTTLLVLSTSQRMSSFIYEGKLPLTAITVTRLDNLEDTMQGFEISGLTVIGCSKSILMIQKFQKLFPKRLRGPMIEKITVLCPNRHECEQWMEYLSQDRSANLTKSPTSAHASPHQNGIQLRLLVEHSHPQENETRWSLAFLRPAPPMYSSKNVCKGSDLLDSNNSTRTGNDRLFEGDALILKVIEGYCATINPRLTIHSAMLEGEPLPKTCNRISISNNKFGNWQLNENRNLAETVDMLKNQISDLQSRMIVLTKQLDDERNSRLSLAAVVKRSIAVTDSSTALE